MKQNQIILITIMALILLGLVAGFSFRMGVKTAGIKTETVSSNPLKSKVIKNWSAIAIGTVIRKGENSLEVESENQSVNIFTTLKTRIRRALLEEGEKKIETISFEDIKIGDDVNVQIGVTENGDIWAVAITVLPK